MSPTNSVSPVSTAHGSLAAGRVDQREGRVLGPVAGRVHRAHAHGSERELPAVVERLVVVLGLRAAVDVDDRAGGRGQAAVPGDVVGMVVRLEDVLDRHGHVAREAQVLADLELGIDDRGHARVLVPDQVGSTAEVVVGYLAEDHGERRRREAQDFRWRRSRLDIHGERRRREAQDFRWRRSRLDIHTATPAGVRKGKRPPKRPLWGLPDLGEGICIGQRLIPHSETNLRTRMRGQV